jgi:hypothetical protein
MSAPRTNIEEQKRRHFTPLMGMLAVVVFAAVLYLIWSLLVAYRGQTPHQPDRMIDGRTGQVEQTEPAAAPAPAESATPGPDVPAPDPSK